MIFSNLRSLREDLNDVFPLLFAFWRMKTDRIIDLTVQKNGSEDWDKPVILVVVYSLFTLAYSLFVDAASVPAYAVFFIWVGIGLFIIVSTVLGPLSLGFKWTLGRARLAFLTTTLFLAQITLLLLLCIATAWAIWPAHVRSDLYLLGRGAGQQTALYHMLCGGLEREADWVRYTEDTVLEMEALAADDAKGQAAKPIVRSETLSELDREKIKQAMSARAEAEQIEFFLRVVRDIEAEEEFYDTYPSIREALIGLGAGFLMVGVMFYWHALRAAKAYARSLEQYRRAGRVVAAAFLGTVALSFGLYLLQQRSPPDVSKLSGAGAVAELRQVAPQWRRELEMERNALRERFERFARYCPGVSNRGLWNRPDVDRST